MKIVQISDTHLSRRGGLTTSNIENVIDHVNDALRPDLVVHSGDIAVADPDSAADRERAHELLARFDAPLRAVPGNHDVGEPGDAPWLGIGVTDDRVAAFEQVWGESHWRHDADGWTVLGLNSELFSSGLDREAEQWRWLERTAQEIPAEQPVLCFLHKPIWAPLQGPTDHALDVGEPARTRLLALLDRLDVRAVGSVHLHRYRPVQRAGVIEVWAPSTAFVAGEGSPGMGEARVCLGVVSYDCTTAGVGIQLHQVPGLVEVDVAEVHQAIADIEARRVGAS